VTSRVDYFNAVRATLQRRTCWTRVLNGINKFDRRRRDCSTMNYVRSMSQIGFPRLDYANSVSYATTKKTVLKYRKHKSLHVLWPGRSSPAHVLFSSSSIGSTLNAHWHQDSQHHFPHSSLLSACLSTPWGRKNEPIFFCVHLFNTCQKLLIFSPTLRQV